MGCSQLPFGGNVTFLSDGTVQYGKSWFQYLGINTGDVVYCTTTSGDGTGTFLPAEYFPPNFPDGKAFYVCQLDSKAKTFKLTPIAHDPAGLHAISSITSVPTPYYIAGETDQFNWRPTTDNGDVFGNDGTLDCYGQLPRATLAECLHSGAVANARWGVNLALAYRVANSRIKLIPGATTTVSDLSVARVSQVTTIPLYPALR